MVRELSLPPPWRGSTNVRKSDLRDEACFATSNLAKELRYTTKRKIVRFHSAVCRHSGELRYEAEVPANEAPDEAFVGEPVQTFVFPVAGGRSKDEGQITWGSSVEKPALESGDDAVRRTDADEAGRGHRVAMAHDGYGILDRHDLGVVTPGLFSPSRLSLMVQQPVGDARS